MRTSNMNSIYMIADLHFGHVNVAKWRGFDSVEKHDELIIENWNKTVNQNDSVYILGDVAMGDKSNIAIIGKLNGHKKLILGNHDSRPTECYLEHVARVYGSVEYKQCILTHIPVHPCEFPRYKWCVHGHLHDKLIDDPRYFSVSCEQINYTPIPFTDIVEIMKERNNNYVIETERISRINAT